MRMAVTHMRHVVVHIEVLAAIGVPQPDTLTSDEVQRRVVKQLIGGAHQLLSALEKL
jgi:hypothetical protein